jgi:hypothetical protein
MPACPKAPERSARTTFAEPADIASSSVGLMPAGSASRPGTSSTEPGHLAVLAWSDTPDQPATPASSIYAEFGRPGVEEGIQGTNVVPS